MDIGLWKDAYERLAPTAKEHLPSNQSYDPVKVRDYAAKKVEDARARAFVVKLPSGKTFIVRDAFEKIAAWITRFVEVGDAIAQYDPGHAALPWAAVRFILKTSTNNIEQHAAIHAGVEESLCVMTWAKAQERLHVRATPDVADELRRHTVELYEIVLHILAKACRFLKQSRTKHFMNSILSSGSKYHKRLDALTRVKAMINELASQVMRDCQFNQTDDLKRCLDSIARAEEPIRRNEQSSKAAADILEDINRDRILDWTAQIPYHRHYKQGVKKALEGTGNWLLSLPDFIRWKQSSSSEMLWLHGMPGSGKSTLMSLVVKSLLEEHSKFGCPRPTYFYCARSEAEKERSIPEQVLRCLVRQLSDMADSHAVYQGLRKRYDARHQEGELSLDDARDLALGVTNDRSLTYIIIDALDECEQQQRDQLIETLQALLFNSSSLVKIFVTSREDRDIVEAMDGYPHVVINASRNSKDIARFVNDSVDDLIRRKQLLRTQDVTNELRTEIKKVLQDKAQGMFRWVELQLQHLCAVDLASSVQERLGKLPDTLSESYERLYTDHCNSKDANEVRATKRILSWLLVARRKLRSAELVALVRGVDDVRDNLTKQTILLCCFNLVEYDSEEDAFRFVHLSVREFLEGRPREFQSSKLHDMAASTCVRIVQNINPELNTDSHYAQWWWFHHASRIDDLEIADSLPVLELFLQLQSNAFARWSKYISIQLREKTNEETIELLCGEWDSPLLLRTEPPHTLLLASALGMERLLATTLGSLNERELQTVRNEWQKSALHIAVLYNQEKVAKMLIEAGSDIEAIDHFSATPLIVASDCGITHLVQTLLERGADVNAQHNRGDRALFKAAERGHENIVRMLLAKGAEINAQDSDGDDALHRATDRCREQVVRMLINSNADINAQNARGRSPLLAASMRGHEQMVRILLDNGAAIDAQDDRGESALYLASQKAHEHIVRLLADRGADLDIRNKQGNSALYIASVRGHEHIVRILLDNGADFNMHNENVEGAIYTALLCGCEHTVQTLLQRGARVNIRSGTGGEAFQLATEKGFEGVRRLLLEQGAEDSASYNSP